MERGEEKGAKDRMDDSVSDGTYRDTVVMTWESCCEPMTDTFAFGHIHRKRGEY